MPSWGTKALLFVAAMALVFAAGFYRQATQDGEGVGFALNFPATAKAAGGMGARGTEGYVLVNTAHTGLIKRMLQPDVVSLSSHFVKNVGTTPRRIRIAAEGFQYPVTLESHEKAWNERTHTIDRVIPPGASAGMAAYVDLPKPLPSKPLIDDGALVVYDADSGAKLTSLPVRIIGLGGSASTGAGGDCCAQ